MRASLACYAIAGVLALAPTPAAAQDPRLAGRLDPTTAAIVVRIADSARAAGLPAEPLIDKALEGASKHASSQRIVDVVRGLAQRLETAREALGAPTATADLVAAAGALYQGVPPAELRRLRAARPGQSLALPLVVLADLIERGVPVRTATSVVMDVARTGAEDAAFAALRRDVEQDIAAGAPPAVAAATRARGTIYSLPTTRAVSVPTVSNPAGAAAPNLPKKP